MRYFVNQLFIAFVCLSLLACTDTGTDIRDTYETNSKQKGKTVTFNWGETHNAALTNFHVSYTPNDIPTCTLANGPVAAALLHGNTIAYLVNQNIDTTGLSMWETAANSTFDAWWPDSVTRRPTNYSVAMDEITNPSTMISCFGFSRSDQFCHNVKDTSRNQRC